MECIVFHSNQTPFWPTGPVSVCDSLALFQMRFLKIQKYKKKQVMFVLVYTNLKSESVTKAIQQLPNRPFRIQKMSLSLFLK